MESPINAGHIGARNCRLQRTRGAIHLDPAINICLSGLIVSSPVAYIHTPLRAHCEADSAIIRMCHIVDQYFSIATVLHASVQRRTQAQAREQGKNEFGVFHDSKVF